LDSGVASASDASAPDAGGASLALDDAQVLLATDTLSAGEIAQVQTVQGALADAGVQAFAAALITEHQAARDTLNALATSLELTPAASSVADQIAADNSAATAALQALQGPDAGSLDAAFTSEQVTALTRGLTLLGELEATASAEALRSELVVLQSILQQELAQARQLGGS